MSHGTHINESCHTYQWVVSHTSTSHVAHINEACHIYQRVMSHISMSHVTHINERYQNSNRCLLRISTTLCTHLACVTWLIHICVTWLIRWNVWHDAFIRVPCLLRISTNLRHTSICVTTLRHTSICVTWLIHMCGMTHSYAWHDLVMGDMTLLHTSFICVAWASGTSFMYMTNSHASFIHLIHVHSYSSFMYMRCLSFRHLSFRHLIHAAPEASWRRAFDSYNTL